MKIGKVEQYINERIELHPILSVVIDPVDWPNPDAAIRAGIASAKAGADLIAVGGSMGAQGELLDVVTREIKENVDVPIFLFPGNIATLTRFADAVLFMRLLNSRNPYWLTQAQTLAAPIVKQIGIEPLPTGYIVVEPGGTVGWVGDANLVPRAKPKIAAALALAGQFTGSRIIFTDAGSAPPTGPVPTEIVHAVAEATDVPYLVAGGIRTPKQAADIIKAGADWIQVGTVAEESKDVEKSIASLVKTIRNVKK